MIPAVPGHFEGREREKSEKPLYGARSFEITPDGVLTGIVYKRPWLPGENLAECMKTFSDGTPQRPGEHDIDSCSHGFYAYYDGSNDYGIKSRVSGVIAGYGEGLLGSRGFRCMKARIVALTINSAVPHALLTKVQNRYRGIQFFPSFEVMVLVFPPDKAQAEAGEKLMKEEQ